LSQEVRQQRRALTLAWSAAGSLLLLAGVAYWQREISVQKEQIAVLQRNQAFMSESKTRAAQTNRALQNGDTATAILLALEGLPDPTSTDAVQRGRPDVPEVASVLEKAIKALRESAVLGRNWVGRHRPGDGDGVLSAVFSPDGSRILTASSDG